MKPLMMKTLAPAALSLSVLPMAAEASQYLIQHQQALCTEERVITDDGFAGTVKALFPDHDRVAVVLDGFNEIAYVPVRNLARTTTCNVRYDICAGDRIMTMDGEGGTVVGLFPFDATAMVNVDNTLGYVPIPLADLGLTNACENINTCKYVHNRARKVYRQRPGFTPEVTRRGNVQWP